MLQELLENVNKIESDNVQLFLMIGQLFSRLVNDYLWRKCFIWCFWNTFIPWYIILFEIVRSRWWRVTSDQNVYRYGSRFDQFHKMLNFARTGQSVSTYESVKNGPQILQYGRTAEWRCSWSIYWYCNWDNVSFISIFLRLNIHIIQC